MKHPRLLVGIRAAAVFAWVAFGAFGLAQQPDARLELVAEGLTSPIDLEELPDGSGRLLVADQSGMLYLVPKRGGERPQNFLDLRNRMVSLREGFDERGVLGVALHPDFRENRRLFVYYSAPLREGGPEGWDHTARLSEFRAAENLGRADPNSERILLQVDQPQFNHNGGSLLFGPDGLLYLSLGDGGAGNDVGLGHSPEGNAQDITNLLGTILRLDVDRGGGYAVPRDNPFINRGDGLEEIYAYGLRNTWGLSFDREGDRLLFGADVGQFMFEEVNIIRRGGNYGWNIKEGFHCFDPRNPRHPPENCPETGPYHDAPLIDPIIEYRSRRGFPDHAEAYGVCVIGGHVYRGRALPELTGQYVFGDWTRDWGQPNGVLLVASPPAGDINERWSLRVVRLAESPEGRIGAYLLAVGEDAEGEIYIMSTGNQGPTGTSGKLQRLVRAE